MMMNRRSFIGASAAIGAGLQAGLSSAAEVEKSAVGDHAYVDRIAFGPWMNDVRLEPLPFSDWPPEAFDDLTVESLTRTFELDQAFGYNIFDIAGLFATWSWPVDLATAATPERAERVRKVIREAHRRDIKVIFLMGVYSWGFDEIIKQDPAVRGPNPHALCGSKEESWAWQKKLIDFIAQWDIDGFHLESADLGRCTCEECMRQWPNQPDYHNYITSRTAQYIREKILGAYLCVTLISWADWNKGLTEQDKNALVDLSKNVDCIIDQGHHSCYVKGPERKPFIERLHCRFGTSGGLWVYPPFRWHRLQWFLPYVKRTGTHMKDLYADGGRGVMYYQGPTSNPGVEVNIAFGGHYMCNVDQEIEATLGQVLERLYKPNSPAALDKLVELFLRAEEGYFGRMDWDTDGLYLKGFKDYPGPGELHLSYPGPGATGIPVYLFEPYLTADGRRGYKEDIEACLRIACDIVDQFEARDKMIRLRDTLLLTETMLRTINEAPPPPTA